jgi:ribosomal-protein-serine acetyltransferase
VTLPTVAGSAGALTLRTWRPEDAPALAEAIAASAGHLAPWMAFANGPARTAAEHAARFEEWEQDRRGGGDGVYGIFLAEVAVGSCGLHRRLGPGALEIGYWVHVGYLRRGIATTAAALLTDTAFRLDGITAVEIHHDAANLASAAVPRRLGFSRVGELARPRTAPGERGLEWQWQMTRESWPARRPDDLRVRPGAGPD